MFQRPSEFEALRLPSSVPLGSIACLFLLAGLAPSGARAAHVTLAWLDNSANESGFKIERATPTGNFAQIGTTSSNTKSYVDTSAAGNTAYRYRVRAYNNAGHSDYTNIATCNLAVASTGNTAPTIGTLANRTIAEDGTTGAIAVTVSDAQTSAGNLELSGTASNTALVPNNNITFGGSGGSRTFTVTPAAHKSGTTNITVTVSDGVLTTSKTFMLVVTAANDAPTISAIADCAISAGTKTIAFTIGDVETATSSLTLTRASSNTTLFPTSGIVVGGSGANRTVVVTPAAGRSGSATITVTVSDGSLSASDSFVLTVGGTNTAPTITSIANQSIQRGRTAGPLSFTVGDAQTAADNLTLSGSSSNLTLVPHASIKFGGSGANRTVTVAPVATQSGTATITVRVSDGALTGTRTFTLAVTSGTQDQRATALTSSDIGTPAVAGSTPSSSGTIQIRAAGADISGTSDQFRFVRQQLQGDAEMIVRVASLQNTHVWAKAGLMFRASLAANAPHVSVFVTPSQGITMQWRAKSGAGTQVAAALSGTAPEWLRLTRTGDTFYAFRSENGVKWDLVEFVQVDLPDVAYGGLAVTSHNTRALTTATFSSFSVD